MTALILIDLQNEWKDKKSAYYVNTNWKSYISKINQLIKYARASKYRIIFTMHIELESLEFGEGTVGANLIDNLDVSSNDVIVTKHKVSPFYRTTLESELNGIDEIYCAGILTNLCVRSLVSDAFDRDYKITLVKDCCLARSEEIQELTLKDLKETRPEINIITNDELRMMNGE